MSIRAKLVLGFLTTALAAAALIAVNYLQLNQRSIRASQKEEMDRMADDVLRIQRESEFAQDPLMLVDALKSMLAHRPEIAWFSVKSNGLETRIDRDQTLANSDVESRDSRSKKTSVMIAFSNQYLSERRHRAGDQALANMRESLGTVLPIALLLAVCLSLSLSRRIGALGKTLDAIGEGRFGATTGVGGRDEIGRLASNINAMSQKLQELESMKRTFIASVTHELRSPLASIESCMRLILAEPTARSQMETDMLRRIESNAARLGHFVTNLLEMAKIERGKLDLHPQQTDIKSLIEDAVLFFEPRAKEAGIELSLAANGDLPPSMRLDPDLITQVVANLVSNAIKFTPKGGRIQVEAHRRQSNGSAVVECSVTDTGVGIPAEAAAKIFAPFQRVPNKLKATGTGLGLAISKSIMELHRGSLGVESTPGKGSRFFFQLPLN